MQPPPGQPPGAGRPPQSPLPQGGQPPPRAGYQPPPPGGYQPPPPAGYQPPPPAGYQPPAPAGYQPPPPGGYQPPPSPPGGYPPLTPSGGYQPPVPPPGGYPPSAPSGGYQPPVPPPGFQPPGAFGPPPGGPYALPTPRADIHPLEAIKFIFRDPDWRHDVLVGSVYLLLPIVGQIGLYGWHCEIMQRLVRGHVKPIPKLEFSDLTHYLHRGLAPFLVTILCALPLSVVLSIVMGIAAAIGVAAARTNATMFFVAALCIFGLLLAITILAMWMLVMPALTRAELTEDVGASISPSSIFAYAGKTWAQIIGNTMLFSLLGVPLALLGYLACFIGVLPVSVSLMTGLMHLRYQIYLHYLYKGGSPIAVKSAVGLPSEIAATGFGGGLAQGPR